MLSTIPTTTTTTTTTSREKPLEKQSRPMATQPQVSGGPSLNNGTTSTPRKDLGDGPKTMSDLPTTSLEPVIEGDLKVLHVLEHPTEVLCCRFSPDGAMLAVGLKDGTIKVYSPDNGSCLYSLADDDTKKSRLPCTSLQFKPSQDTDKYQHLLLATYASGFVKFWHVASSSCLKTHNENRQTLTSAFNSTLNNYITAGCDGSIRVYDMHAHEPIRKCQATESRAVMDGHRARIFAVKYHPLDAFSFISGGWDDTVQYWDHRLEHSVKKLFGPHICGDTLDIDPHKNLILTGSWRKHNSLQLWDFNSGELVQDIIYDVNPCLLYSASFVGRDKIVVGGSDMNAAKILDRRSYNTFASITNLRAGVFCIDHSMKPGSDIPRLAIGTLASVFIAENRPVKY